MIRSIALAACAALLCAGCASTRVSTTERTAVEQALLSRSALDSIQRTTLPEGRSLSFVLDDSELQAIEKEVIKSAIRQHLLVNGFRAVEEDGDLTVMARANFAAVDDSRTFIGIPAIPIPIPGVGALETPEIALYRRIGQRGRAQIDYYAVDAQDGSLAFSVDGVPAIRGYTRWTLLVVVGFRTTDLGKPF